MTDCTADEAPFLTLCLPWFLFTGGGGAGTSVDVPDDATFIRPLQSTKAEELSSQAALNAEKGQWPGRNISGGAEISADKETAAASADKVQAVGRDGPCKQSQESVGIDTAADVKETDKFQESRRGSLKQGPVICDVDIPADSSRFDDKTRLGPRVQGQDDKLDAAVRKGPHKVEGPHPQSLEFDVDTPTDSKFDGKIRLGPPVPGQDKKFDAVVRSGPHQQSATFDDAKIAADEKDADNVQSVRRGAHQQNLVLQDVEVSRESSTPTSDNPPDAAGFSGKGNGPEAGNLMQPTEGSVTLENGGADINLPVKLKYDYKDGE